MTYDTSLTGNMETAIILFDHLGDKPSAEFCREAQRAARNGQYDVAARFYRAAADRSRSGHGHAAAAAMAEAFEAKESA